MGKTVISEKSKLINAETLGMMLGLTKRSIFRYMADGGILPEPLRFGGAVRWRRRDIENWIKAGCPKQFDPIQSA